MSDPQQGLPQGWLARWDQQSNHWFYVDERTGRTQWDRPGGYAPPQQQNQYGGGQQQYGGGQQSYGGGQQSYGGGQQSYGGAGVDSRGYNNGTLLFKLFNVNVVHAVGVHTDD